jgi:hypothetical protein
MKETGLSTGFVLQFSRVVVVSWGKFVRVGRVCAHGQLCAGAPTVDATGSLSFRVRERVGGGEQRSSLYRLIAV